MNFQSFYRTCATTVAITFLFLGMLPTVHLSKVLIRHRLNSRFGRKLHATNFQLFSKSLLDSELVDIYDKHVSFLSGPAKVDPIPQRFRTLLQILELKCKNSKEEDFSNIVPCPTAARKGINPFLVPIAENVVTKELLSFIRWPTQKANMDLQIVRASADGMLTLVSLGTDQYCHRLAVEMDFFGHPEAGAAIALLNSVGEVPINYKQGDFLPFLKSGKFPAITPADLRLVLDRFLLTKVGAFPDCYERLANDFFEKGNTVSALVTCERASSVFYGWGHPMAFHSNMLQRIPDRDKEARDTARASMSMPKWTLAPNKAGLQKAVITAGFTDSSILGDLHAFRARDVREKDVAEGLSPIQVTLDQAAHLMDAVALGISSNFIKVDTEAGNENYFNSWDDARVELASKYRQGGYPDMADFILAV